jgi:hypothetical protein
LELKKKEMEKKIQLATTETVSSNYAGEAAERFFSAVLTTPTTVANGGVEVVDGIQYKWNLPRLNLSGIIADATCDFTPAGTITRNERVLTVEAFEVNLQLCKETYRPTFDKMGGDRFGGLAPTFADHLIGLAAANVAQSRENTIWKGNYGGAQLGEFNGIQTIFTNEPLQPTGYEIAGTTVTAANVVAQLQLVLDAASSALYSSDGFGIRIGTNIMKHYIAAQAALGYLDRYNVGSTELNFQGVPLIHCAGMTDDVMVATYANNLYYGIGSAANAQQVLALDQTQIDGSDNVNVVMKWADGAQVANPEDVITYGITNAGN